MARAHERAILDDDRVKQASLLEGLVRICLDELGQQHARIGWPLTANL
jgi:hypothetical protein